MGWRIRKEEGRTTYSTRVFPPWDQLRHLQGTVQNENAGPRAQKTERSAIKSSKT